MNPAPLPLSSACLAALDRLDRAAVGIEAVGDLLSPCPDLDGAARDRLAVLLGLLTDEAAAARQELTDTLRRGG